MHDLDDIKKICQQQQQQQKIIVSGLFKFFFIKTYKDCQNCWCDGNLMEFEASEWNGYQHHRIQIQSIAWFTQFQRKTKSNLNAMFFFFLKTMDMDCVVQSMWDGHGETGLAIEIGKFRKFTCTSRDRSIRKSWLTDWLT